MITSDVANLRATQSVKEWWREAKMYTHIQVPHMMVEVARRKTRRNTLGPPQYSIRDKFVEVEGVGGMRMAVVFGVYHHIFSASGCYICNSGWNQGYASYEKIYLGSVFFFQLSGGNLTNYVIRGITIYGNSRDYHIITSGPYFARPTPEEMHDGHVQFLGTCSIPMHARWYCKSNCFCECGPSSAVNLNALPIPFRSLL